MILVELEVVQPSLLKPGSSDNVIQDVVIRLAINKYVMSLRVVFWLVFILYGLHLKAHSCVIYTKLYSFQTLGPWVYS